MYVYIESERGYHPEDGDWVLYTVGFYNPDGKFITESDHGTKEEARQRVHYLNGGNKELDKR